MGNKFLETAFGMRRNGWMSVVQVREGTKAPRADGWPQYAHEPASDHLLARWAYLHPHDSVGFAYGGAERILGVDLDFLIEEAANRAFARMKSILGPTDLLRIGQYPKRLGLYRYLGPEPLPGKFFSGFELFFKTGVQTVFFGTHPDTGQPYDWPIKSPLDLPPSAAPEASHAKILELIEELRPLASPKTRAGVSKARRGASPPPDAPGASDRFSGSVANVLGDIRAASDPLAATAEIVADARPGSRYPSAFGAITSLVKLGFDDKSVWDAVSPAFAAHFPDPSERRSRLDTIASALRWARAEIGPDAETLNAIPAFKSLQLNWEAGTDG